MDWKTFLECRRRPLCVACGTAICTCLAIVATVTGHPHDPTSIAMNELRESSPTDLRPVMPMEIIRGVDSLTVTSGTAIATRSGSAWIWDVPPDLA